jgi:hemolysin III
VRSSIETPHEAPNLPPAKPLLRGRFHQAAFVAAIPAGVALVLSSPNPRARLAALIYAISLAGLYGTSSAYHRLPWSPRAHAWMKRLDHSMIFVLIAGTYTPLALLVLQGAWSVVVLCVVWAGALLGIALKMVRIEHMKTLAAALYISLGWLAIVAAPQLFRGLSGVAIGLMLAGGILYTTGSIVLATHRPDPSPRVFGYHEIWHAFVVAASVCHFALITLIVRSVA